MIDYSVIIVSWNAKNYLSECLQSLNEYTFTYNTEIIVVDNASTDGSPSMVQKEFPHVNLIINEYNYGFAKGNNIGINQSKGTYLFLINSDVFVKDGCIEKMIAYMDVHPDIGILGPKILDQCGKTQRSCMELPSLWNTFYSAFGLHNIFGEFQFFRGEMMTYWSHNTIRQVDIINGCFWMVRKEALDEVGLLDEQFFIYSEDKDWCKRFHETGWDVVFYPEAEAIHYGGASSANAPIRFEVEMQKANLQYWKKHHSKWGYNCYLLITLLHHMIRVLGYMCVYLISMQNRHKAAFKIKRSYAIIQWLIGSN
jgi:GT2 family glycosyltransferase